MDDGGATIDHVPSAVHYTRIAALAKPKPNGPVPHRVVGVDEEEWEVALYYDGCDD